MAVAAIEFHRSALRIPRIPLVVTAAFICGLLAGMVSPALPPAARDAGGSHAAAGAVTGACASVDERTGDVDQISVYSRPADSGAERPPQERAHVEFHAFAGMPLEVAKGIYGLPREVVSRGFYALLFEGGGRAEVRTFTRARPTDDHCTLAVWEGTDLGGLPGRLAGLLFADEAAGADGTGTGPRRAVESMILGRGAFADLGVVPCPVTARGAFGHPLRNHPDGAFLRAIVLAV